MRYPIKIKPDGRYFMVTFPDISEALTQGATLQQARRAAKDALESALDFYFDQPRAVPMPSRIKRGQEYVELPASLSAKILLLNEMIHQRVRPAELARRLNVKPQEITRLMDLRHTTRIDGIALALATGRDHPNVAIMLMTGYADQRERTYGLDALVRDVIAKPFSLEQIKSAVRGALVSRH